MRILVIRNEPPWPLCYGGRLSCYELCQRLARRHDVLLLAQRPCEPADYSFDFECWVARGERFFEDDVDLAAEGFEPSRSESFFGISMLFAREVRKVVGHWAPDVVVGMNYQSLACLARLEGVPTVLDLQDDDVLHMILELWRGKRHDRRAAFKTLLAGMVFQRQRCRAVDAVALNSAADRRTYQLYSRHPRVECIPHGVDCNHYAPSDAAVDSNRVVFWGGLGFGPNVSAIRFFAEQVWPRVLAVRPQARWSILGPGEAPGLEDVGELPSVDWLGFVDDIRPHVREAAAAIVPMRTGAGIKNKIMEAWALGTPVVCTPRALGDLPGVHGENVWVARSPQRLAAGVLRIMEDPAWRRHLASAARDTAVQYCSWDVAAERFEALCQDVAGQHGQATPVSATMDPAPQASRVRGAVAAAGGG